MPLGRRLPWQRWSEDATSESQLQDGGIDQPPGAPAYTGALWPVRSAGRQEHKSTAPVTKEHQSSVNPSDAIKKSAFLSLRNQTPGTSILFLTVDDVVGLSLTLIDTNAAHIHRVVTGSSAARCPPLHLKEHTVHRGDLLTPL